MKILLDENVPHDFRHLLIGHDVFTVAHMGWASFENGELLAKAGNAGFNAIITKDTGVAYQQHLATLPLAVVILRAKTNKLDDLRPLVPGLLDALSKLTAKTIVHVG